MAEPVSLPRLDPPVNYAGTNPELIRWMSELVDLVNQAFSQIEPLL